MGMHRLMLMAAMTGFAATALAQPATRPVATQPSTQPAAASRASMRDNDEIFFRDGIIPRLHIDIAPADIEKLRKDHRTDVRATIRESIPGEPDVVYADVSVHIKGGPGSLRS